MGWFKSIFGSSDQGQEKCAIEDTFGPRPGFPRALHNVDIIRILYNDYNIDLCNSHKLHLILEEMGVLERNGSDWLLTEYGRNTYTSLRSRVNNPVDCWNPQIVDGIARYIQQNNIDVNGLR